MKTHYTISPNDDRVIIITIKILSLKKNRYTLAFYIRRFKVITRIRLNIYYRLKAFLKWCVLSVPLKESKVLEYVRKSGRLFQSLGDAQAKDLSP